MPETQKKTARYVTLKEAAKISGYSPDYLGQLIRKGKLAGKQIYLNVAWVTTEKALREYLENNKVNSGKSDFGMTVRGKIRRWLIGHNSGNEIVRIARRIIYVVIALLFLLCLFLVYAFAANAIRGIRLP
jgi:RNase P/RNase MRP subunit POP5